MIVFVAPTVSTRSTVTPDAPGSPACCDPLPLLSKNTVPLSDAGATPTYKFNDSLLLLSVPVVETLVPAFTSEPSLTTTDPELVTVNWLSVTPPFGVSTSTSYVPGL